MKFAKKTALIAALPLMLGVASASMAADASSTRAGEFNSHNELSMDRYESYAFQKLSPEKQKQIMDIKKKMMMMEMKHEMEKLKMRQEMLQIYQGNAGGF